MEQSAITRTITVAAGRFAPGHLGELTQQVPFEMVDAVLAETGTAQRRVRDLPARVVVYLLLAGCLFAELGYRQVWHRLVAGLDGLAVAGSERGRVDAGPPPGRSCAAAGAVRPAARPGRHGRRPVRWRGLLVCAIDGTIMSVADSPANLARFAKQRGGATGGSGYPMMRLLALVACGTRTVIDAVFGPVGIGETTYARRLVGSLRAGMLVLADRNFAAGALSGHVAGTGADLLVRAKTGRYGPEAAGPAPPPRRLLPVHLRRPAGPCHRRRDHHHHHRGRRTGVYRLVTTLLDPHRYPAVELIRLYHERWEIETAYLELKSTILGGRVLRARTPTGDRPGDLRPAGHLPDPAHRHGRRHQQPSRPRPRPGQLHHRPARRPRPARPGRRRHRRHRHRPGRHASAASSWPT